MSIRPQPSVGGVELAYAEITANPGDSSHINTTASFVAVTGLSISPVVGTRPIKLRFGSQVFNTTATRGIFIAVYESAALVSQSVFRADSATASAINTLIGEVRLTPSAGAHTYEVRIASTFATSSAQLLLGTANNYTAFIEAVQR